MLGLYGMLEFMLCCEILLLLNMADMVRTVFYVEDCGVNSCNAEYLAHLVCMNIGYGGGGSSSRVVWLLIRRPRSDRPV